MARQKTLKKKTLQAIAPVEWTRPGRNYLGGSPEKGWSAREGWAVVEGPDEWELIRAGTRGGHLVSVFATGQEADLPRLARAVEAAFEALEAVLEDEKG